MTESNMAREAAEAPDVIRRLLDRQRAKIEEAGSRLARASGPLTTAARGSSDHAATAFKYVCEIMLGRPVASIGPSVASIYQAPLRLAGGLHISVSQSGASPDIVALQEAASRGGAGTMAILNVVNSPLAAGADMVLPIDAGEERSVAATKSFLASAAALFAIVAHAGGDDALLDGLAALPDAMEAVPAEATIALADELSNDGSFYVTARGPALGIAFEAALKAKEAAGLHVEAVSLAELMHGPLQLVGPGFPVVVFAPCDAALTTSATAVDRLRKLGAGVTVVTTADLPGAIGLPTTGHPVPDILVMALAWYLAAEAAARRRGLDPDRPSRLRKVTRTV